MNEVIEETGSTECSICGGEGCFMCDYVGEVCSEYVNADGTPIGCAGADCENRTCQWEASET